MQLAPSGEHCGLLRVAALGGWGETPWEEIEVPGGTNLLIGAGPTGGFCEAASIAVGFTHVAEVEPS